MSSNDRSGCEPLSSRSTRPGLGVRSSSERAPPTSADARTRRSRRLVAPPTSSARCRPTRMHSTAGRAQIRHGRAGRPSDARSTGWPFELYTSRSRSRPAGSAVSMAMAERLTASGGRPAVNVAHGPSASIPRATSRAGSSRSTASPAMRERQRAPGGHFSGPGELIDTAMTLRPAPHDSAIANSRASLASISRCRSVANSSSLPLRTIATSQDRKIRVSPRV